MGLKRDSMFLFGNSMVAMVTAAASSIIVARTLGPEGKGILYLFMLLPAFVASLGSFGLRGSAVYFAGRGSDLAFLARFLFTAATVLSLVYFGVGWLLRDVLETTILRGLEPQLILFSLLLIPVILFRTYGDGFLHGIRRFGLFSAAYSASAILKLVLLALGLLFLGKGLGWAVGVYVLATVLPALVSLLAVVRWARPGGETHTRREILRYGLAGYLGNLAQRANLRLDVFILNPYVGPAGVGIYSVAVLLGELVWRVPEAVGQALLPRVAGATQDDARSMTEFLSRTSLMVSLLVTGGLLVISRPLVVLLFTGEFLGAVEALVWLAPGLVVLSVSKIVTKYLAGVGRPILNSYASLIALAVNVPLLFLLVPRFGIVGASAATSIAYVVQTAAVLYFFVSETGRPVRFCLVPVSSDFAIYRGLGQNLLARLRNPAGRQS